MPAHMSWTWKDCCALRVRAPMPSLEPSISLAIMTTNAVCRLTWSPAKT